MTSVPEEASSIKVVSSTEEDDEDGWKSDASDSPSERDFDTDVSVVLPTPKDRSDSPTQGLYWALLISSETNSYHQKLIYIIRN